MSEIEKMFENAGIKPIQLDYPDNIEPFYPEFTAEKQLSLIKWIATKEYIDEVKYYWREIKQKWVILCFTITEFANEAPCVIGAETDTFETSLAGLINILWQDLTAKEKEQIKEILE